MVNTVILRKISISARKAQLVCDLIRNQPVSQALVILSNTDKKISPIIRKLLNSAIANATNNHAMNAEALYVYNIFANQGPTLKRTSIRARGSSDRIRKRSTHLEIHLSDNPNQRKEDIAAQKAKRTKAVHHIAKRAEIEQQPTKVKSVKKATASKVDKE